MVTKRKTSVTYTDAYIYIYTYTRTHARTSYNNLVWVTAGLSWLPWRHTRILFNLLNAELNPICHLLALLGAHLILHVSRIWVKAVMKVLGTWNSAWILLYPVVWHSRLQQMYKLNLVTRWPAKCRVRDGAPNSKTGSMIMPCLVRVTARSGSCSIGEWWLAWSDIRNMQKNMHHRFTRRSTRTRARTRTHTHTHKEWTRDCTVRNQRFTVYVTSQLTTYVLSYIMNYII